MNHYMRARANQLNCSGTPEQLQRLQEMFPLHAQNDENVLQSLNKHFDGSDGQHVRFLQQACFKTPLADVARVYQNFRLKAHPGITEPRISNYFPNEHFVALDKIQEWLDGNTEYPSLAKAEGLQEDIAEVLLCISQEFGYIPNLQRLLLYYPQYLIKLVKFKNIFFEEQMLNETQKVAFLSPKNCCFAGIIAAIELGCPYMIARMVNMFLVRGGSPSWISQKKYPQQFRPLFGLFRKISVSPWSITQADLQFSGSNWDTEVYFDLITVGVFVMSMSTICLAMGLKPDEPCRLVPLENMMEIKQKYDGQKYESIKDKMQFFQEIRQLIGVQSKKQLITKEQVKNIEQKQIEPYMKEIGNKLSSMDLQKAFNQLFSFIGLQEHSPINMKVKNNSFFSRHREIIDKGLEERRKSDRFNKFEYFRAYCIEGATMTFNTFGMKQQNARSFRKWIQIMTQSLCGHHHQSFDYKKNIKLNISLTMPLKFYVRLLSISPVYINKQVLEEINQETKKGQTEVFDFGYLAIMVAENKAKLLMSSLQFQLFK